MESNRRYSPETLATVGKVLKPTHLMGWIFAALILLALCLIVGHGLCHLVGH